MVREIYRLFVDERLSLNAIIVELEARGIRSQSGRERWSRSLVHSIVSRETYTGTAYMFKHYATEPQRGRERGDYRRVRNSSRRQRQREDWIPVRVPAIIPREVWERAGERLAQNQRLALRNTRRQYLLRGLVRCAACGQSWRGQFNTGYLYYCCGGKRRDGRPKGERCRAKAVRVDRLEPVVWDTVRGLLESPELLVAEYRKEFAHRQAAAETVGKQREETERRIQSLADEEMRVVRLYREGKIGRGVLEGQLEEIQRRRSELEKELAQLRRADTGASAEALEAGVWRFCEEVRAGLEAASFEERQEVLRLLVDRVEMAPDGNHATLYGVIPVGRDNMSLRPCGQAREKVGS